MDQNHIQFQSIYDQVCGHIEWFNIQSQINQAKEVKKSIKDQSSQDYFNEVSQNFCHPIEQIPFTKPSTSTFYEITENGNSSNSQSIKDLRKKIITKNHQKSNLTQKQKVKRSSKINPNDDKKSTQKKSKFNNMGGFLIGTFSEILNIRGKYRFVDGIYQIFIHGKWIKIGQINQLNALQIEIEMTSLKFKLSMLPRKQGAKKHLFEILNDEVLESSEKKLSKSLLRKQLVYSLGQKNWLLHHVSLRDFKPENDDHFQTKKKERHEAYLSYLIAIEFALRCKNMLPKRITI